MEIPCKQFYSGIIRYTYKTNSFGLKVHHPREKKNKCNHSKWQTNVVESLFSTIQIIKLYGEVGQLLFQDQKIITKKIICYFENLIA